MKKWLAISVLALCGVVLCVGVAWCARSHDEAFAGDGLAASRAENLKATVITPHLEAAVEPGRNVLWCGTFQLVWNDICSLIGEDVHFSSDPAMVAPLNSKSFTRAEIDDASFTALAGFVRDGILGKIPKALNEKFHGQALPHLFPEPALTPRPQDIVGYAYLFKHLEFATPFERLDESLTFMGASVSAFGIGLYKPQHQNMYPQISILVYGNPDDFVIELKTKSAGDQLILAKVQPEKTLLETVTKVCRAVAAAKPAAAGTGDVMAVPRFNFDLVRSYAELYGQRLVATNPGVAKDLQVLSAMQSIRFEMDEKGVQLKSESHMSFGCGTAYPAPTHIMLFDKPFLVLLKRTDAAVPYFAMWVGNPELLIPLNQ